MSESRIDILGLGAVAVDDLLCVDHFPEADQKVHVRRRERQCGGLAGTALTAAARLGSKCAYGGVLGEDELSEFVASTLMAEGVDISHLVRQKGARPFHSTIIVDMARQTRNIFVEAEGVIGASCDSPSPEVIFSTRVLLVDHVGLNGMIRAAKIAREAGIPVVGDFERGGPSRLAELIKLTDHVIVPLEFASEITGESDPVNGVRAIWDNNRDTVVITAGDRGCWYMDGSEGDGVRHQPAFGVEVVDATGCGDVFHGAYASALVRGLDTLERIRFASAAAAIKATRLGGQVGMPHRDAVEKFLEDKGL